VTYKKNALIFRWRRSCLFERWTVGRNRSGILRYRYIKIRKTNFNTRMCWRRG